MAEQSSKRSDEEKLSGTALRIYLYLLSRRSDAVGPREIARALGISPSLAYYHLRKMEEMGIVKRCSDGYRLVRTIDLDGFVTLGTKVVPHLVVYSMFFLGVAVAHTLTMLLGIAPLNLEGLMLVATNLGAFGIMFFEGMKIRRKLFGERV